MMYKLRSFAMRTLPSISGNLTLHEGAEASNGSNLLTAVEEAVEAEGPAPPSSRVRLRPPLRLLLRLRPALFALPLDEPDLPPGIEQFKKGVSNEQ